MCSISRKEKTKVRNAMSEYVSDIIEDAQDFGWASEKGAHMLSSSAEWRQAKLIGL